MTVAERAAVMAETLMEIIIPGEGVPMYVVQRVRQYIETELADQARLQEQLTEALKYAVGRLNSIPHPYADTDFTRLREALEAARGARAATQPAPTCEHGKPMYCVCWKCVQAQGNPGAYHGSPREG